MNIFYIDKDPRIAAKAMTNKHVVKMILESAQLLSAAHHILDGDEATHKDELYKITHQNHPSAIWTREAAENYNWLYEHFRALCDEYTIRYNKVHLTEKKLAAILSDLPRRIPAQKMTKMKLAITNEIYHDDDPITAYRNYYAFEKLKTNADEQRFFSVLRGR